MRTANGKNRVQTAMRNEASAGLRSIRLGLPAVYILAVTATLPRPAHAQIADAALASQVFQPAIGTNDVLLSVEPASVAANLRFALGSILNYQRKPLVLFRDTTVGGQGFDLSRAQELAVVKDQLTLDLIGVIGLHYRWLHTQIGLSLPINLLLSGTEIDRSAQPSGDLDATGIGDLQIQLKVQVLRNLAGFSLAFSPIITLPTGDEDQYGGEDGVGFRPRLVADYRIWRLTFAANLGWLVRKNTRFVSSELGDRLLYGVGARLHAQRRLDLIVELAGQAGFSTQSGCIEDSNVSPPTVVCSGNSDNDIDAFPVELLTGGRMSLGYDLHAEIGIGFGLVKAIGSPQVRAIAGLRWAPDFTDTDGDGIRDAEDRCPAQPEDRDRFEDGDGCPDPDNDKDLLLDPNDRCPLKAEDRDTFQDEDGCPDPDNDKDGIEDVKDSCPLEPETKNGFKDADGCPDIPDQDGDGIADKDDRCPKAAEDKDNYHDEDGCPDPDNDNDDVPDASDACPLEPEDADSFEDSDGCPDPDNDRDGVLDAADKCPREPETINGIRDNDGCPDRGKPSVVVKADKIVITKRVYFATGRAKIRRRSYSLLRQVAQTLRAHPEILVVRVEGHTDSRGRQARNKRLSQARASAVRKFLIARGEIAEQRLVAKGYGSEQPIEDNRTRRGRAANRRVEFKIVERKKQQGSRRRHHRRRQADSRAGRQQAWDQPIGRRAGLSRTGCAQARG